jgi:hypothetical protein
MVLEMMSTNLFACKINYHLFGSFKNNTYLYTNQLKHHNMPTGIRIPKPTGIKDVMTRMTIMTIPENALLDGVERLLAGRESFKDTDKTLNEKVYQGDVFEAILGEVEGLKGSPMYPSQKTLGQLEELAEFVDTDYVLITKA